MMIAAGAVLHFGLELGACCFIAIQNLDKMITAPYQDPKAQRFFSLRWASL